jgi:hypothetical protein
VIRTGVTLNGNKLPQEEDTHHIKVDGIRGTTQLNNTQKGIDQTPNVSVGTAVRLIMFRSPVVMVDLSCAIIVELEDTRQNSATQVLTRSKATKRVPLQQTSAAVISQS